MNNLDWSVEEDVTKGHYRQVNDITPDLDKMLKKAKSLTKSRVKPNACYKMVSLPQPFYVERKTLQINVDSDV